MGNGLAEFINIALSCTYISIPFVCGIAAFFGIRKLIHTMAVKNYNKYLDKLNSVDRGNNKDHVTEEEYTDTLKYLKAKRWLPRNFHTDYEKNDDISKKISRVEQKIRKYDALSKYFQIKINKAAEENKKHRQNRYAKKINKFGSKHQAARIKNVETSDIINSEPKGRKVNLAYGFTDNDYRSYTVNVEGPNKNRIDHIIKRNDRAYKLYRPNKVTLNFSNGEAKVVASKNPNILLESTRILCEYRSPESVEYAFANGEKLREENNNQNSIPQNLEKKLIERRYLKQEGRGR